MVVNATMPSRSPRVTISVSKWIIAAPSPSRRRGETDEPGLVRVVVDRIRSLDRERERAERGHVDVPAPGVGPDIAEIRRAHAGELIAQAVVEGRPLDVAGQGDAGGAAHACQRREVALRRKIPIPVRQPSVERDRWDAGLDAVGDPARRHPAPVVVRIESARCGRVRGAAAVPLPVERGLVIVEAPGREFPEPARPGLLDPDVLPPRGDPGREPPRVAPQAAVPAEERIVTAEREEGGAAARLELLIFRA